MRCPKCYFEAASEFSECPRCGVIVSKIKPKESCEIDYKANKSLVPCITCSTKISVNARFCPVCGEPTKKFKGGYLIVSAIVAIIIALVVLFLPTKKAENLPKKINQKSYNSTSMEKLATNTDKKISFDDLELIYQDVYWYEKTNNIFIPTLRYKILNKSDKKLNNLAIRAVYVQYDDSVFSQTTDYITDLDPGLTSQCRRLSANKGYETIVGLRGNTMTLNLYGKLQGQEKLLSTLTLTDMQIKSRYEELEDSLCQ